MVPSGGNCVDQTIQHHDLYVPTLPVRVHPVHPCIDSYACPEYTHGITAVAIEWISSDAATWCSVGGCDTNVAIGDGNPIDNGAGMVTRRVCFVAIIIGVPGLNGCRRC